MQITLNPNKSRIFTTLIDILSHIVDETNIEFRDDGLFIQTMDTSKISLFELTLSKDWFDNYTTEKNIVIGIKFSIINKILNCRNPSQSIELSCDSDETDKIDISLINGGVGVFDKYFQTNLYDFDYDMLNITHNEYDAEFCIDAIVFYKLFDQLKQFGETIKFICGQENIVLETLGDDDFTGMKINIPEKDIIEYSVVEEDDIRVDYNINLIHKALSIARLSKDPTISDNIKIYVSTEAPVMIEFNICENCYIKFWIAPKLNID